MSFISFISQNYSQVRASKMRFSDFCFFFFFVIRTMLSFSEGTGNVGSVMRESRQQMHWNSGMIKLRFLETWCLHNCHSKWKLPLFLVNQVTAQSHLQVSSACGWRPCELFVTGLWSLLYKMALGCCCGLCCAMVMTHCHLICSVKLIHLLYLLCFSQYPWLVQPKFLSFKKNESITWNRELANTVSFDSCNNPRGKEEPSPVRLDRAFSEQGCGRRSWVTEGICQSIR